MFHAWTSQRLTKFSLQVGHSTNSNIRTPLQSSETPNGRVEATKSSIWAANLALTARLLFQHGFRLGYYSNIASGSVTIAIWHPARLLFGVGLGRSRPGRIHEFKNHAFFLQCPLDTGF